MTHEERLKTLLASIHGLSFKTHVAHYYIKSISFKELHELFGQQYNALNDMEDRLAEYLIINGMKPCISIADTLKKNVVPEFNDAQREVVYSGDPAAHIGLIREANEILLKLVKETKGDGTRALENILGDFEQYFSKQVWFLSAYFK